MAVLQDLLEEKGFLLADGATGTNFFAVGLEAGYPPELWNFEKPEAVLDLHEQFITAGSDLILTNSFGGTSYRLKLHGAEDRVAELNIQAARLARQVADAADKKVIVAGSMGPTGELFAPLGVLTPDLAVAAFKEQAEALATGGVDILHIETISSFEEIDAAYTAAESTGLPVVATMTFDTAGRTMMGVEPGRYGAYMQEKGATAVGANCGVGPAELMHSILAMQKEATIPLIAKGNCGIPEYRDHGIHYHGTPELMASYATLARDAGIKIIGGCCGTKPQHIAAMRQALDTAPIREAIDLAKIEAILGPAWQGIGEQESSSKPRRTRRRGNR